MVPIDFHSRINKYYESQWVLSTMSLSSDQKNSSIDKKIFIFLQYEQTHKGKMAEFFLGGLTIPLNLIKHL